MLTTGGVAVFSLAIAIEQLVDETERLAVRTGTSEHRLMIVIANRVVVSEELEQWCAAVSEELEQWCAALLGVEEFHSLPGVMRCVTWRRAVSSRKGDIPAPRGIPVQAPSGITFEPSR